MALTINTNIKNDADGYSLDAKNVKGTFVVCSDSTELDNLPVATIIDGSLVYLSSEEKFYQWNNATKSWVDSNIQLKLIDSGEKQNIKTINNQSILGTGNITVAGGIIFEEISDDTSPIVGTGKVGYMII